MVAPPQLDPAPAVQPKQWGPMVMRREARDAGVASKIVCGASTAVWEYLAYDTAAPGTVPRR